MTGSLHVGLAALGAAIGVGLIGQGASIAVGRNPGASTKIMVQSILAIAFAEAIVFYALFLVALVRCPAWRRRHDAPGRTTDHHAKRVHDHACSRDADRSRESWTDRADRQHLRRQLAPSRRADRQLRHRVRGAVHARLQADPADSGGAAPADCRRPGQRREDQGGAGPDRGGAPGHPDQGRRRGEAIDRGSPRGGRACPGGGDAQGDRRRRTDCRQGA